MTVPQIAPAAPIQWMSTIEVGTLTIIMAVIILVMSVVFFRERICGDTTQLTRQVYQMVQEPFDSLGLSI